ncbi:MAG: hypothetical protein J6C57_03285, partial [Paludibacteraceae bacterium]|nr:hypothetical protein [Paludibacteraceae bacterium]
VGNIPTTDEHRLTLKHGISVQFREVQWLKHNHGRMSLRGKYTNHRRARIDTETRNIRAVP